MRATLAAAVLLACTGGAVGAAALQTGVNGHPFQQEGYRDVPVSVQLDLVARLGAGWYRCDLGPWALEPQGEARVSQLLQEAARRRIRVLPILFPPGDLGKDDEAVIRRKAREYARAVVARHRAQVRVWELHNELDGFAMIRKGERDMHGAVWQWGDPAGDAPAHYEEGRYRRARAVLLGLAEGVRDADPTAQRLINTGGWLHFGFVQRLIADAVPFEILGWHWYSEMGDIARAGGADVLARITAFGKPIWLNEVNRRGGSQGAQGEAEQATTLTSMTRRFRELAGRYPIRAVMAYELLDEPYFGADNPESHYGLVRLRKGANGRWMAGDPKPAFEALRRAFAATPARSGEPTLAHLAPSRRAGIDLRLRRRSDEIGSSPFATLTSFEVHGESEDADVVRSMRELGVKWVVMHNIHGSLPDPADRRLNAWLELCRKARIGVRCILASRDRDLWVKAVRNYGDRIHHFGFLNEPNAPTGDDHTRPHVPPDVYARELGEIGRAVKAVRPDVQLYAPEMAMLQAMEEQPYPWLRRAIEAGMLAGADGISIHPYRQAYSPSNIPENPSTFEGRPTSRYRTYEEQIGILRSLTGQKPLAVTEVGWSTAPLGPLNASTREAISEVTQAKFALRQQILDFALGMDAAVYFLLRERHVDAPLAAGHIENHFGIVRVDNSPKPAYTALQTLYSQLDSRSRRNLRVPVQFTQAGVKWYVFDDLTAKVPVRRLVYWLPVPARDDFPVGRTDVSVDGVRVPGLWVSDAPRILRLHRIGGRWGWPALIELMGQSVDDDVAWLPAAAPRRGPAGPRASRPRSGR